MPLLVDLKLNDAAQAFRKRVQTEALRDSQHYYSDSLALFGLGWLDGRFRFDRHGELHVAWNGSCRAN